MMDGRRLSGGAAACDDGTKPYDVKSMVVSRLLNGYLLSYLVGKVVKAKDCVNYNCAEVHKTLPSVPTNRL